MQSDRGEGAGGGLGVVLWALCLPHLGVSLVVSLNHMAFASTHQSIDCPSVWLRPVESTLLSMPVTNNTNARRTKEGSSVALSRAAHRIANKVQRRRRVRWKSEPRGDLDLVCVRGLMRQQPATAPAPKCTHDDEHTLDTHGNPLRTYSTKAQAGRQAGYSATGLRTD